LGAHVGVVGVDGADQTFIADVDDFDQRQRVPLITFRKVERKEDIVLPHRLAAKGRERGQVAGKAREKTSGLRFRKTSTAHGETPQSGASVVYQWIVKTTARVNHFNFYCLDDDFGPLFLNVCTRRTAHRWLPGAIPSCV
jgi:hypothetical protein